MLWLKFTPTFSHSSLSLRQLLCALRSPARRAQDPMLRLQSKFTHNPSFDFRLALFFEEPSFAMLIQGGVLCSPLVVYGWCYTSSLRLVFHTTHRYRLHHSVLLRKTSGSLRAHYSLLRRAIEGEQGKGIFDCTISLRSARKNMRGLFSPKFNMWLCELYFHGF